MTGQLRNHVEVAIQGQRLGEELFLIGVRLKSQHPPKSTGIVFLVAGAMLGPFVVVEAGGVAVHSHPLTRKASPGRSRQRSLVVGAVQTVGGVLTAASWAVLEPQPMDVHS